MKTIPPAVFVLCALLATVAMSEDKPACVEVRTKDGKSCQMEGRDAIIECVLGNGSVEILELLLNEGHDVNKPWGREGWTFLHWAAWRGSKPDVVKMLIRHGADVGAKNPAGLTALDVAKSNRHPELFELLQVRKADTEEK